MSTIHEYLNLPVILTVKGFHQPVTGTLENIVCGVALIQSKNCLTAVNIDNIQIINPHIPERRLFND